MNVEPRVLWNAFKQFMVQIYQDSMLIILCIAPILCGSFFKFILPWIEDKVAFYLPLHDILQQYYLLFDLFLCAVTPLLYCFAAAYVILSEVDEGLTRYLAVTPIGKLGYLITRMGIPAVLSFFIGILMLGIFRISDISIVEIVAVSLVTSLLGIVTALVVVALSANKVEGMAISKLTGLLSLGLPAPFFITGPLQYLLCWLPSFWISKFVLDKNIMFIIIGFLISLIWIYLLYDKFDKKIR